MSDQLIKGRARLLIDKGIVECAPVKIETPKYGQIAWHTMEVQGLFDLFKSFLVLPSQYEILGVYFGIACGMWILLLESADIPIEDKNKELPLLHPIYWVENGKVSIRELKSLQG